MILVIDNYDSFTFNLVQYLWQLKAEVQVVRNDFIDVPGIRARKPRALLISPGPCAPAQAGVSVPAIRELSGTLPILGVCLGHQSIGEAFGGKVVRAKNVMHGKTSRVVHQQRNVFRNVPTGFEVGRYHSLVVEEGSLPPELEVIARAEDDGEIMALAHRLHPTVGVQFHPESVLTPDGMKLLANFLEDALC